MWYLCIFLLLQQPAAQTTPPGTVEEEEQPTVTSAPAKPTYDHGPFRAEVVALFDARYRFLEDMPGARKSELRMQWRLSGERITEVARVGDIILTEAVDDTGKALVDPEAHSEEQRTKTRPMNLPAERLRSTGLLLPGQLDSPSRAARSLKIRGTLRLVLATQPQEITIDNPLQYVGKTLENEQLKELGVEIYVPTPEELLGDIQPPPPASRVFAMQYRQGQEQVQTVSFHDAWMKPLRHRERPMKTKKDEAVVACMLSGVELNADCQLVLSVFSEVENVQVPIEVDDLQLP